MANLGVSLKRLHPGSPLKEEDGLLRLVVLGVVLAQEQKSVPVQGVIS